MHAFILFKVANLHMFDAERLEANRDLKMTVERLAVTHELDAVLHNLKYAKLVGTDFRNAILPFYT